MKIYLNFDQFLVLTFFPLLPWWKGKRLPEEVPQCLLCLFIHRLVIAAHHYVIQAVNAISTQTVYRRERAEAVMPETCSQVFCVLSSILLMLITQSLFFFLTQCAFYTQHEFLLNHFFFVLSVISSFIF